MLLIHSKSDGPMVHYEVVLQKTKTGLNKMYLASKTLTFYVLGFIHI